MLPPEQIRTRNMSMPGLICMPWAESSISVLTGKPPIEAPNLLEMMKAKDLGTFVPASQLNPDVPASIDRILLDSSPKYRNIATPVARN